METLDKLLSDPRWDGIQGILALCSFLLLIIEKRKLLFTPLVQNVIRFAMRTAVLLISGLIPTLLCSFPLSLLAIPSTPAFPLDLDIWSRRVASIIGFSLIVPTVPAFAAMSVDQDFVSHSRARMAGIINSIVFMSYMYYTGIFGDIINYSSHSLFAQSIQRDVEVVFFGAFLIIGIIATIFSCWVVLADIVYLGVARARSYLVSKNIELRSSSN